MRPHITGTVLPDLSIKPNEDIEGSAYTFTVLCNLLSQISTATHFKRAQRTL